MKALFLGAACVALSAPLHGAELTPYTLPSEKRMDRLPEVPVRPAPPQPVGQAKEDYYKAFEAKSGGLSRAEKLRLIDVFLQKQKTAESRKSYEEAQH